MRHSKLIYALILIFLIVIAVWKEIELQQTISGAIDRPIYLVPTSKRIVALTFDISWGQNEVKTILALLKEYEVKATFFLSGPWVTSHPELAQDIKEAGHEIASHGHRHINYSSLPPETVQKEVRLAQEAIYKVTGVQTSYIRTPNGDYDEKTIQAIRETGHTAIHWSVDSKDWLNPGVPAIIDNVLKNAQRGSIILLHASNSAPQTPEALPAIITGLQKQGFQIGTVGQLLSAYHNRRPPLAR